MTATYSDKLRFTKQGVNDNPNTWGTILNEQVIELIEEAIAGVSSVTITGSSDVTLTTSNGTTDQSRHATLVLTGVLGADINLLLPATEKQYFIRGAWTGDYTVTVKISGSSTSVDMETGDKKIVYIDGVDIFDMTPEMTSEFSTGDLDLTFKATPKTGWIFVQGQTIGSAASGASLTGTSYESLYAFLWDNLADTEAPVSSGRGGSAAADWTSNKTLTIPDLRDRTPFGVGTTWARVGQTQGVESATIAKENLPAETLSVTGTTNTTGAHTHEQLGLPLTTVTGSGGGVTFIGPYSTSQSTGSAGSHSHTVTGTSEAMGSGTALSILPKGFGVNWMIKL